MASTLIITEDIRIKGGIAAMYRHMKGLLPEDALTVFYASSSQACSDPLLKPVKWSKCGIIYLFRVFLVFIHSLSFLKDCRKVFIFTASPLYAFPFLFFCRRVRVWFATPFYEEIINRWRSERSTKEKIVLFIEYLLLPFYFILENLTIRAIPRMCYALSERTKAGFLFKKNISIQGFPLDVRWFSGMPAEKEYDIITVGRFNDPRKDLGTFLKTMRSLDRRKAVVIGRLPDNFDINGYPNIHFTGEVEGDIGEFYLRSRIFFLPSVQEGLGIVYLEAMASGLPVIAADNGGSRDLVKNGLNGYIIKKRSPAEAADRIETILSDEKIYDQFSSAAREYADKYSRKAQEAMEQFLR